MFTKTLLFGLMATGGMSYQTLNVIWSSGSFETISGPGGDNEIGHDSGFTITDEDGNTIYANGYPGDHSPCYNTGDGRYFTLKLPCWKTTRSFKCKSTFDGSPDQCSVYTSSGKEESNGVGNEDTTFFGIGISESAHCGTAFFLNDGEECHDDESGSGVVS